MSLTANLEPLIGGLLIGLSAALMLLFNGRITGISGIIGGIWSIRQSREWWRLFFVVGLVLGTVVYSCIYGAPSYQIEADYILVILGGLLVGYGTRLGSGCTSGHGVCGIGRLSMRSIVATMIFMASAILTVWIRRQMGGLG